MGGGEVESRGAKSKSTILPVGTWSKIHLRQSELAPWTKGRDGWSEVGGEISKLSRSYHFLLRNFGRLFGCSKNVLKGDPTSKTWVLELYHECSPLLYPIFDFLHSLLGAACLAAGTWTILKSKSEILTIHLWNAAFS